MSSTKSTLPRHTKHVYILIQLSAQIYRENCSDTQLSSHSIITPVHWTDKDYNDQFLLSAEVTITLYATFR